LNEQWINTSFTLEDNKKGILFFKIKNFIISFKHLFYFKTIYKISISLMIKQFYIYRRNFSLNLK